MSSVENVAEADGVDSAAHEVVKLLTNRGETLAAAESLTAGLLCATVATVPGASAVLRGGVVTYATDVKALLADVPESVLDTYGPVAEITARYMALGVANKVVTDWGISLTGVAGPTMQDGHPVGEVWCGLRTPGAKSIEDVTAVELPVDRSGSRSQIRRQAVELALELLIRKIGVE